MDLNYPFRSYPIKSSNIITPFINDVYIKNVKRLYNEIDSLCNSINENDLVLLIIGSLIDEQTDNYFSDVSYYQHFPQFVKKYIEENKYNNVRIICISPILENNIPQFIAKTMDEFKWLQIDDFKYVSKLYNITYDFYQTLFPEYIEDDFVNKDNKEYYLDYKGKYLRLPKIYYKNRNLRNNFVITNNYIDQIVLKLKDNLFDEFYNIYKSSPSEHDKYFVDMFNQKMALLANKLQDNSGSMLVLNYAVFCENWICTSFYYFFETFYKKINKLQNVKILNYDFIQSKSSNLIEYKKRSYDYEYNNIILKIGRKGRLSIINNVNNSECNKTSNNESISQFKIIQINGDGDCLFNAILKQVKNDSISLSPSDIRKVIYQKLIDDKNKLSMIKDELQILPEYEMLTNHNYNPDKVLELHLYFIKEGPYSEEAENLRTQLNLPFSVFFGGNCEIGLLGNLFNVNIKVVNYDNNIINVMSNSYDKTIYIKFNGNHYDIAIPTNYSSHYEYKQINHKT